MISEALIGLMLVSMVVVLILAWRWFGSLRTAFIVMLIIGKVWAGILYLFGIDKELFNLVIYNKVRNTVSYVTVTANQAIFISLLITLLGTISWPYIEPYLPEPVRRLEVIRR